MKDYNSIFERSDWNLLYVSQINIVFQLQRLWVQNRHLRVGDRQNLRYCLQQWNQISTPKLSVNKDAKLRFFLAKVQ